MPDINIKSLKWTMLCPACGAPLLLAASALKQGETLQKIRHDPPCIGKEPGCSAKFAVALTVNATYEIVT